ncbi:hypothetical protein ALIPUT_02339 [Alistipes putredinis DSM 17216]|uniref:Uncharacterized protein n=1 Tax=Alistipes putredinis DSM 17216 TaxID=445970 RepID=B0MYX0_9BACT|nr:hypothetical protein ALIPUT_02339 [Alistipes putredinis DSM 17216]
MRNGAKNGVADIPCDRKSTHPISDQTRTGYNEKENSTINFNESK